MSEKLLPTKWSFLHNASQKGKSHCKSFSHPSAAAIRGLCWDQVLAADTYTLPEPPFSLGALLTIRKDAGGIPNATGAVQETKTTALESRIFHPPWEQELAAVKSHDRYMESVGSSYSAAFLGKHLPPDLTQTITLSLGHHQWTGWAEPLSLLVFFQNPLC